MDIKKLSVASLIAVGVLGLASCMMAPPTQSMPLIQGLTGTAAQISTDFDQRLKTLYPVGSDPTALVTELVNEGFATRLLSGDPDATELHFDAQRQAQLDTCSGAGTWSASWSAAGGKITQVQGSYTSTCP